MAQEESRSISENVTWGHRKRFSDGKIILPYKRFLGYDHGEKKDDPPVVNPEQAVIVRRIYRTFMEGKTTGSIAKELTAEGIPTPSGKTTWQASTVRSILSNEKYRGSARLQKGFTTDFLTKKRKVNEGEIPQYYVEFSHEAIIDPPEWEAVQQELARRKSTGRAYSGISSLGTKIRCGDCGGWYGSKVWHSTDKYRCVVWQCNNKFDKSKPRCETPHLKEEDIKARFISAYNSMISDKTPYILACETARDIFTDTAAIDSEMNDLLRELEVVTGLTKKCIEENSITAQDQTEYIARYNGYVKRYEKAKGRYDALADFRAQKLAKAAAVERFMKTLSARDELLTEFDRILWFTVVDTVTVNKDGSLTFRFYDGTEIII